MAYPTLDTETRLQIEAANRPVAENVIEAAWAGIYQIRSHEGGLISMRWIRCRTGMPLWGRTFQSGGDEVTLAENWICDRWGFFGAMPAAA
jgi:hypothetical protein